MTQTENSTPSSPKDASARPLASFVPKNATLLGIITLATFATALWLAASFLNNGANTTGIRDTTERLFKVERLLENAKDTKHARLEFLLQPNKQTSQQLAAQQAELFERVTQLITEEPDRDIANDLNELLTLFDLIHDEVARTPKEGLRDSFLSGPLSRLTDQFFVVTKSLYDREATRLQVFEARTLEIRKRTTPVIVGMVFLSLFLISAYVLNQRQANTLALRSRYLEQVAAEKDRADILARELSHRVKNLFAVISSIVSMTARHEPDSDKCATKIRQRITALSIAHGLTTANTHGEIKSRSAHLRALIHKVVEPYRPPDAKLIWQGGDLPVGSAMITPIGLVFNELATNALKYGAWSNPKGRVEIALSITQNEKLGKITWRETGGPELDTKPLGQTGFGTKMIEASLAQMGLQIRREWLRDGLSIVLEALPRDELEMEMEQ